MEPWLAAVIVVVLSVASVALVDAVYKSERNQPMSRRGRLVVGGWFLLTFGLTAFFVIPH